ncbi:DUF1566 domain-containing protein, partial [bacterium]|nr:DUF1566 domain-containing protein [bacterium]
EIQNICSCSDLAKECCASCDVGSICGGGTLFGKVENGSQYNFVVIPAGCDKHNANEPICTGDDVWDDESRIPWALEHIITNTNSNSDGLSNQNIIASNYELDQYPVFNYCSNLVLNGFDDWYLPAKDELNILFKASNRCNINENLCSYGENGIVSGFIDREYWSSTEEDGNKQGAWAQDFNNGEQATYFKINQYFDGCLACCIRRF